MANKLIQLKDGADNVFPRNVSIKRSDIITGNEANDFLDGTAYYAWIRGGANMPYTEVWATIFTQSDGASVANQQLFSNKGFASRHYENGSWSAWKKIDLQ